MNNINSSSAPQDKYLYKPFLGSSHFWAIENLKNIPKDSVVLDIGCGSGAIGAELRSREISQIYAVEVDARAREHVKNIYLETRDSIDGFASATGRFNVILLLDVLEHTTNPSELLEKVENLLAPGGMLLLSVPNVAHWSIRLSLLLGFFEYTSRGILDNTHFRFFTKRTLGKLIEQHKTLRAVSFGGSIVPVEFLIPEKFHQAFPVVLFRNIRHSITQVFQGLCAYQLLCKLNKK